MRLPGQLASATGPDGDTVSRYDGAGRRVSEDGPHGTVETVYDAAGLPVEVVETASRLRAILPPRQQGPGGVAEGSLGAWVGECGATS